MPLSWCKIDFPLILFEPMAGRNLIGEEESNLHRPGAIGSNAQKVRENKSFSLNHFAGLHTNGLMKKRAVINEGMKLAVFTAGIYSLRQICKKIIVKLPARKGGRQLFW